MCKNTSLVTYKKGSFGKIIDSNVIMALKP